jgi:hypothetical protein
VASELKVRNSTNSSLEKRMEICYRKKDSAMKIKLLSRLLALKKPPKRDLMIFKRELNKLLLPPVKSLSRATS